MGTEEREGGGVKERDERVFKGEGGENGQWRTEEEEIETMCSGSVGEGTLFQVLDSQRVCTECLLM